MKTRKVNVGKSVKIYFILVLSILANLAFAGAPEFNAELQKRLRLIPEFETIREWGIKNGVHIWLGGGTATGITSYLKEELDNPQFADRFSYTYYDIYRSTQDADIVIDGTVSQAEELEQMIQKKFDYLQGSKKLWEVRLLKTPRGTGVAKKDPLIGDTNFRMQNTDSFSTALVELTTPSENETVIRDLFDWEGKTKNTFLEDIMNGEITFYRNELHSTTERAKLGYNPEIVSVIRAFTKAFQYNAKIKEQGLKDIEAIIQSFDPNAEFSPEAVRYIKNNAMKLFLHARDLERAWNELEASGLRKKLIQFATYRAMKDLRILLNREPLRSFPLGKGTGRTAEKLRITEVAHETSDFLAYENITMSRIGKANLFISRQGVEGESAAFGNGAYTAKGKFGARGTGLTIRYQVHPDAREGADFFIAGEDSYVIFLNRNALITAPEDRIHLSFFEYFNLLEKGKFTSNDLGVLKKLELKAKSSFNTVAKEESLAIYKAIAEKISKRKAANPVANEFMKSSYVTDAQRTLLFDQILSLKKETKPEELFYYIMENGLEEKMLERRNDPTISKIIDKGLLAFEYETTIAKSYKNLLLTNIAKTDRALRDKIENGIYKSLKKYDFEYRTSSTWRELIEALNLYLEDEKFIPKKIQDLALHSENPRKLDWYSKIAPENFDLEKEFKRFSDNELYDTEIWRSLYKRYSAVDSKKAVQYVKRNMNEARSASHFYRVFATLLEYPEFRDRIGALCKSFGSEQNYSNLRDPVFYDLVNKYLDTQTTVPNDLVAHALSDKNPRMLEWTKKTDPLSTFEFLIYYGLADTEEWRQAYQKLLPTHLKEMQTIVKKIVNYRNWTVIAQVTIELSRYEPFRALLADAAIAKLDIAQEFGWDTSIPDYFKVLNAVLEKETEIPYKYSQAALIESNPRHHEWAKKPIAKRIPSKIEKFCTSLFKKVFRK